MATDTHDRVHAEQSWRRPAGAMLLSFFTVVVLVMSVVFQLGGVGSFGLYTTALALVTAAAAALLHARTR